MESNQDRHPDYADDPPNIPIEMEFRVANPPTGPPKPAAPPPPPHLQPQEYNPWHYAPNLIRRIREEGLRPGTATRRPQEQPSSAADAPQPSASAERRPPRSPSRGRRTRREEERPTGAQGEHTRPKAMGAAYPGRPIGAPPVDAPLAVPTDFEPLDVFGCFALAGWCRLEARVVSALRADNSMKTCLFK